MKIKLKPLNRLLCAVVILLCVIGLVLYFLRTKNIEYYDPYQKFKDNQLEKQTNQTNTLEDKLKINPKCPQTTEQEQITNIGLKLDNVNIKIDNQNNTLQSMNTILTAMDAELKKQKEELDKAFPPSK
jgi:hypothetical protein